MKMNRSNQILYPAVILALIISCLLLIISKTNKPLKPTKYHNHHNKIFFEDHILQCWKITSPELSGVVYNSIQHMPEVCTNVICNPKHKLGR